MNVNRIFIKFLKMKIIYFYFFSTIKIWIKRKDFLMIIEFSSNQYKIRHERNEIYSKNAKQKSSISRWIFRRTRIFYSFFFSTIKIWIKRRNFSTTIEFSSNQDKTRHQRNEIYSKNAKQKSSISRWIFRRINFFLFSSSLANVFSRKKVKFQSILR
jgi:hypothetical protein